MDPFDTIRGIRAAQHVGFFVAFRKLLADLPSATADEIRRAAARLTDPGLIELFDWWCAREAMH